MITQIEEIGLPKLTNGEHLGFHSEVQLFLNECGAENISASSEQLLYDAAVLAEVDAVKRQLASVHTAELDQLDKERNKLLSFLFATLDASKNAPIEDAKEAYRHLLPVLTPYRGMGRHTHIQKSGETIGLLKDLRMENLAQHIIAINLTAAMDMLETKNNAYMNLDKQRIKEIPTKVETDTLRKTVDEQYHQIINKANATITLATNGNAEKFVEGLNHLIDQTNHSYNMRMAHSKKEDDADEEIEANDTDISEAGV